MMNNPKGIHSACVREIKENRSTKPHTLPIYATSSFVFDDIDQGIRIFSGEEEGHSYSRYGNPTLDSVAKKIAMLESHNLKDVTAEAILCSSGMSAILTMVLGLLKSGDKILTQANLYGGTTEQFLKLLKPNGIEPIFSGLSDLSHVEAQLKEDPSIKLIYIESPANPTMACVDLQAISNLAHTYGAFTAVDNTFCSPYLQQPFAFGIDFIVHSTTKYLNGHGNSLAGALVARDPEIMSTKLFPAMRLCGTNCNSWDAWLINNGMKTLALRMDKHSSNALAIAQFLEAHEKVKKVNYPGLESHPSHHLAQRQMKSFGGMLSFEVDGTLEDAIAVMRKLKFCILAPTLGDVDTLVLHPASMSHRNVDPTIRRAQGISDNLIRLSVGIEDPRDIIDDLAQSLA